MQKSKIELKATSPYQKTLVSESMRKMTFNLDLNMGKRSTKGKI